MIVISGYRFMEDRYIGVPLYHCLYVLFSVLAHISSFAMTFGRKIQSNIFGGVPYSERTAPWRAERNFERQGKNLIEDILNSRKRKLPEATFHFS